MANNFSTKLTAAFAVGLCTLTLSACTLPGSTTTKTTPASTVNLLSTGEILEVLRILNEGEIEQAELVAQRSQNGAVLAAAERVIEDHRRYNQRVVATARLGRPFEQSPLSKQLVLQSQQAIAELAELNGAPMDCFYLRRQIKQHQMAVDTVQSKLLPEAQDEQVKLLLTSLAPALEHHLQTAQKTLADVGECTSGTR